MKIIYILTIPHSQVGVLKAKYLRTGGEINLMLNSRISMLFANCLSRCSQLFILMKGKKFVVPINSDNDDTTQLSLVCPRGKNFRTCVGMADVSEIIASISLWGGGGEGGVGVRCSIVQSNANVEVSDFM